MGGESAQQPSACSYAIYYVVAFFAHWFGSKRLDFDGDGGFDVDDVQAFLAEKGLVSERRGPQGGGDPWPSSTASSSRAAGSPAPGGSGRPKQQVLGKAGVSEGNEQDIADRPEGHESAFDMNGDGVVDLRDCIEAKIDGEAQEAAIMRHSQWFMPGVSAVCFVLWLGGAVVAQRQRVATGILQTLAGLETAFPGRTDLRLATESCEDLRGEVWRLWTYQFTHIGALHVMINCALNLVLGVPLEAMHGPWRTSVMFNMGVVGGALCYMVNDAHTRALRPWLPQGGGRRGLAPACDVLPRARERGRQGDWSPCASFLASDALPRAPETGPPRGSARASCRGPSAGVSVPHHPGGYLPCLGGARP
mmetsp:Transcript_65889/g.190074  ORF Transcript_65889/g.190074 Transcript_65889/m.190074 type:complete len:363 (+) Transcript_65889:112-1200(+)